MEIEHQTDSENLNPTVNRSTLKDLSATYEKLQSATHLAYLDPLSLKFDLQPDRHEMFTKPVKIMHRGRPLVKLKEASNQYQHTRRQFISDLTNSGSFNPKAGICPHSPPSKKQINLDKLRQVMRQTELFLSEQNRQLSQQVQKHLKKPKRIHQEIKAFTSFINMASEADDGSQASLLERSQLTELPLFRGSLNRFRST